MAEPRRPAVLSRVLLGTLAALTCVAFVGLGLWQLGRADRKANMLEGFERALAAPQAEPLPAALAREPDGPRRVAGRVNMPPALPWLLLDNQRRGAAVGLRAYRLAKAEADQTWLLIEFGWLPLPASTSRELPSMPAAPSTLDVDGLLLAPPAAGIRLAANPPLAGSDGAARLLTYIDPTELGAELGQPVYPQVLRPDPALPLGFHRDAVALPNTLTPAQHRGYAVQWFGLAAAVAVIASLLLLRRRA